MRWLVVSLLFLASCLAKTPATVDAGPGSLCESSGGQCVSPESCLEQLGDISCGASLCCVPVPAFDAGGAPTEASAGSTTPVVPIGVDANVTGTATMGSGSCNATCESLCVNDPNCIEACGC